MSRIRILVARLLFPWWEIKGRYRVLRDFLSDRFFRMSLYYFKPSMFERKFKKELFKNLFQMEDFIQKLGKQNLVLEDDKNRFCVSMDMKHYLPEKVCVKIIDKLVIVEARHQAKGDIPRHFLGNFYIPEQCDTDKIISTFSSDILTIIAPKSSEAMENTKERVVEIKYTGKPAVEEEIVKKAVL